MRIIFVLCFIVSLGYAQKPFFSDPIISGTTLVPSAKEYEEYLLWLKTSNFKKYSDLTKITLIPTKIDEEHDFKVFNFETDPPNTVTKTFVLKIVENNINIWVEKAEFGLHVTDQVLDSLRVGLVENTPSGSLDNSKGIYVLMTEIFGSPPDIDGNGKVEFLLTDIQDGWDGQGGYVGGYFSPSDQHIGGNNADILYVDTYPGIYHGAQSGDPYNVSRALGNISHELQHLIQYAHDTHEVEWVNEGLSELATYLCGYGLRSPALYLQNTGISINSWSDEEPLPHYSRAALWTYFLYEKFGLDFIKDFARNSSIGETGLNNSLNQYGSSMENVVDWFFKTLSINDPVHSDIYVFDWEALQHLRIDFTKRIIDYPEIVYSDISPYALQTFAFTNGNDLDIFFKNGFSKPVYFSRIGNGRDEFLLELFSNSLNENTFGNDYHTLILSFINNSANADDIEIIVEAEVRNKFETFSYINDDLKYLINSDFATNAIQYISNIDSSFIKSVEIYTDSPGSDIIVHLYNSIFENLTADAGSQSKLFPHVVRSGWTRFDVEDMAYSRNSLEWFNVGIEYVGEGAMGYNEPSGNRHSGHSFIKNSNEFRILSDYKIGTPLIGSWMIRLEIAKKISESDLESRQKIIDIYSISPNPFTPTNKGTISFNYLVQGDPEMIIKIYNVLGQLVYKTQQVGHDDVFKWNGKNLNGQSISSGVYIISMSSPNNVINKKFILIR